MKITIAEIARQAEVSKGTVSRVINGKSTVAEDTRRKVVEVMDRLGYEPDPVARELSMRTKFTLGIWVGAGENRLSPYFNLVWRALLREMQNRATQFVELPEDLSGVNRHLDAVLLFHSYEITQRLAALAASRIPAVLIGNYPGVACVGPDDIEGGRIAGRKLVEMGHRNLLHLTTGEDIQWARERGLGFTEALERSGCPGLRWEVVRGAASVLGGYRLMHQAWQDGHRPTGVFCGTDEMAIGALGALEDLGVEVPGQVSVVGFDGLAELCPGLASVAQDIPGIAHQAVSLALAMIHEQHTRQTVVPVRFVSGATLGHAPRPGAHP